MFDSSLNKLNFWSQGMFESKCRLPMRQRLRRSPASATFAWIEHPSRRRATDAVSEQRGKWPRLVRWEELIPIPRTLDGLRLCQCSFHVWPRIASTGWKVCFSFPVPHPFRQDRDSVIDHPKYDEAMIPPQNLASDPTIKRKPVGKILYFPLQSAKDALVQVANHLWNRARATP